MLGSLLDQIPGAFSRRFLLGVVLPLFLFCVGSFFVGATFIPEVQGLATWFEALSAPDQALVSLIGGLSLGAVALALSSLSTLGRLVLEGNVPDRWVQGIKAAENVAFEEATKEFHAASEARRTMTKFVTGATARLVGARNAGDANSSLGCDFPLKNVGLPQQIDSAAEQSASDKGVDADTLVPLVDALEKALRTNHQGVANAAARELDQVHDKLLTALDNAEKGSTRRHARAVRDLEGRFPGNKTYATRFGRVAGRMSAYADRRYGADHAVLWPRLEAVARKEQAELFGALDDTATKLEFHVAMFWTTAVFTLIWTVALAFKGLDPILFVLVAGVGPLGCWVWYELGARSYESLADQTTTVVDLVRLRVFTALGLEQPTHRDQEMKFWADLGSSLAYGGPHTVPYEHAPAAPARPTEHSVRLVLEEGSPPPRTGGAK